MAAAQRSWIRQPLVEGVAYFFMSCPMMLFQLSFARGLSHPRRGRLLSWFVLFAEVIKICKVFPVPHFALLPQLLLAFSVGS